MVPFLYSQGTARHSTAYKAETTLRRTLLLSARPTSAGERDSMNAFKLLPSEKRKRQSANVFFFFLHNTVLYFRRTCSFCKFSLLYEFSKDLRVLSLLRVSRISFFTLFKRKKKRKNAYIYIFLSCLSLH